MKSSHLLVGALVALLPVLALSAPGVANATTIDLDNPTAVFSNHQGGKHVTGEGTNEIRWGKPTGDTAKSGLRFDPFTVDPDTGKLSTSPGSAFDLGTLHHFNWEVKNGTAISSVDLTFAFDIDDVSQRLSFTFNLGVDETNNTKAGCDNTPTKSGNWCPDIISFPQTHGTQTFVLGGQTYTFNLLGFGSAADDLSNDFITQEFADNSTDLWANISTPSTNVPEPSSLMMMGFGLLTLLGFLGLRSKLRTDKERA